MQFTIVVISIVLQYASFAVERVEHQGLWILAGFGIEGQKVLSETYGLIIILLGLILERKAQEWHKIRFLESYQQEITSWTHKKDLYTFLKFLSAGIIVLM